MTALVEIPLEKPIFVRSRIIRKLRMRAPEQIHIDAVCAEHSDAGDRGTSLLALLCNVPAGVFAKLSEADQIKVGATYEALSST